MEATHPRNCLLFGDSKQKINRQDMDFGGRGDVSLDNGVIDYQMGHWICGQFSVFPHLFSWADSKHCLYTLKWFFSFFIYTCISLFWE